MDMDVSLSTYFLLRYTASSIYYGMAGFSAAIVAAKGIPDPWISVVSFTAPMLGGMAEFILNDYSDRKVDRYIRPWRPLVTGKMKAESALILAFMAITTGFLLTITLYNLTCFFVALLTLALALIYNASTRRRYIAHGLLATNLALCIVYGYAAAANELTTLALIMMLMAFTDSLSTFMITSVPDIVGDRVGGAITAAVRLGERKAAGLGLLILLSNIVLGVFPFGLGYLNTGYLACFLSVRIALLVTHIFLVKDPNQRFGTFTIGVQFFSRMCVFLSFIIGVLPTDVSLLFAPILCILMIMTPITFYRFGFEALDL